jgi:hypothetical protein
VNNQKKKAWVQKAFVIFHTKTSKRPAEDEMIFSEEIWFLLQVIHNQQNNHV